MKKNSILHRGRFQAQGENVEKSVAWNLKNPETKSHAYEALDNLKDKLTKRELEAREKCFEKAVRFVETRSPSGIVALLRKSCLPTPPVRDIRVDIEVLAGIAFKDD